ncbi:hypothetical protein ID866_7897 [Astraeus odoratus]|nr:hypothetical protein ID866_7897 [Astraeus odoratus]
MLNIIEETVPALYRRAADLYECYEHGGGTGTLEEAISLHQQVLELDFINDAQKSESLDGHACCMKSMYESQGALGDLEEAISLHKKALDLCPVSHPNRTSFLGNLASCMLYRYESQGALEDLEEAISLSQHTLDSSPVGHPKRSLYLTNLAICKKCRYQSQGALGDLEEAISLHQKALDLCPVGHPSRPLSLSNLADCLQCRYQSKGALGDLKEAISLNHQALNIFPAGHLKRFLSLNNLANCMQSRYESEGELGDLEEAISLNQQVLDLSPVSHPNRLSLLGSLATCMQYRYESQGALGDLEEAISFNQQALDLFSVCHPERPFCLSNLANCMQWRYRSQGALGDLEEAISLNQQALSLLPVGHPRRSITLTNIGSYMRSRYESQGTLGDLEQAISFLQEALNLCHIGSPKRMMALNNLAICVGCRYLSQGALGDLEEAISLYQQAWDLCPVGHPMRSSYKSQGTLEDLEEAVALNHQALNLCPIGHSHRLTSLGNLAGCMQSRYESQRALGDLEEAISLYKKALDLSPLGHPNRSELLDNLACCVQSRYKSQGALISSSPTSLIHPDAGQLIRNAMQDILHDIPPRLLQTNTGILLTQAQMIAHFCESTQYQTLVTFLERSDDWHINVKHMQEAISDYFQYSTLSHRWGPKEPTLRDILGSSIYSIPPTTGLVKLQRFCHIAALHGYSWAWSDTCCIDKTNSVELQKAIGSMFLWYQKSALTIVYLSDIPSSPFPATLSGSEWFKRGWTLQELLAPSTILFYTQDWSPYMHCTATNHKQDAHVLNQLVHAARIPPHYLSKFNAGMDNARSKLEWAVGRHTTVLEDSAYSLFGLFNLHLPVLYGEGKDKSLMRLFKEILSQSHDISILHWVGEQSSCHSCFPANITSYQPLPCMQPKLTSLSTQSSMLRLQQLISSDDAHQMYNKLIDLPCVKFTDYMLALPCIIHHVQFVKQRQTYINYHTYEVQAVGLRPLQVITSEYLMESMQPIKSSYVLVRPWDRNLVNYLEEDHVMAGYKALMELEKPFMALMLVQLPEGEYKRICTSHFIVVCPDDPASIVNSKTAVLDIV